MTSDDIPSLDSIQAALKAAPMGTSALVSLHSGLAYDTIRRIARGERTDVRVSTLRRIRDALNEVVPS